MHISLLILCGQLLAILITLTGVFSQLLSNNDINIPTTQSLINYTLLACTFTPIYLYQKRNNSIQTQHSSSDSNTSHTSNYIFILLALIDVEGNYMLVKSYQYTTITSVQLLDCSTIPYVVILSKLLLHHTYTYKQICGAGISLLGMILLIGNDIYTDRYDNNTQHTFSDSVIGDICVLCGCMLYAISNVCQEYIVRNSNTTQWLCKIGLFGTLWSILQIIVLERHELSSIAELSNNMIDILYCMGFSISMFMIYTFVPFILNHSNALFLNLSFLSADFFALLFAQYLFKESLNVVYFIAFGIIICGLLTYNIASIDNTITFKGTLVTLLPSYIIERYNLQLPTTHEQVKDITVDDDVDIEHQHDISQNKTYQKVDVHDNNNDYYLHNKYTVK